MASKTSEKALHSLFEIRKHSPKTATKIFDSIISPILLYNSEVSGVYKKNDFNKLDNSEAGKVHLKFCKIYLGVNRKANNIACRSELGKYPLLIAIKKNIIDYFKHILKRSFLMSKQLYNNDKESFYTNAITIL